MAAEDRQATTAPAYAQARADYAPSRESGRGAWVTAVREGSPAWAVGIEPGMCVTTVNGQELTDMIVWLWETGEEYVDLDVFDPRDGTTTPVTLEREPSEDWGLTFCDAVFDGMRTCVNACTFCFMGMLPKHLRTTLYIRDDDYRLSFLQGNFVTLTNLSDADVHNIIEKHLSPMNVSLHAVTPDVRRRLIGKNAQRGMDVLEALIAADLEIHAQIVLCPGVNDGAELDRTLAFCEGHSQVTSLAVVPLGYTKYARNFSSSFSDDLAAARAVVRQVEPYQKRARKRCGRTVFQLSDEFYLDAGLPIPEAEAYDGYPQYYDGIGMLRSYLDEAEACLAGEKDRLAHVREALDAQGLELMVLSGCAAADTIRSFVEAPELGGSVVAVKNNFFGGNVDVTGLMCVCDILDQLPESLAGTLVVVPNVMFNADGLTLDSSSETELTHALFTRGAKVLACSTTPCDLLLGLERLVVSTGA